MKRAGLLLLILAFFHAAAWGQRAVSSFKPIRLDIGFSGCGVSYEAEIRNRMSAEVSAGIGPGYDISEEPVKYGNEVFFPAYYLIVNPKIFLYIRNDSPGAQRSFVGLRVKYILNPDKATQYTRNGLLINGHWGMQKTFSQNWMLALHGGFGYALDTDNNTGTIYPSLDFKFSFMF